MTDYNVGISKIYQFIKNDIMQMDLDGNGEIIEAECKYFLKDAINKGELTLDGGEKPNDLISAFWKKINTNRAGKSIVSLDSNEIDSMNKKIAMYEKFEEYFNSTIVKNLGSNKYITDTDSRIEWQKSVKESLLNSVDDFVKQGGKPEQLAAFLEGQLDNKYYADPTRKNLAQLAMNKTTANIYAKQYINEQLGNVGKTFNDLTNLINNLVTKEIGDGDMTDEVISKTKDVVDDYISQASGSYNFSESDKRQQLTEYQGYVLKNQITKVLSSISNEEGYADNKDLYDSAVTAYVDSVVSGSLKGDYNNNLKLTYEEIMNSADFKEVKDKIAAINDLKTLPDDFWSGMPDNITLAIGKTENYSLPNFYTTPNGVDVTSDRISYKSSNAKVSVDAAGEVTVKAGTTAGTSKVSISVMVDGNVIGTKEVTIKVLSEEECFKQSKGSDYQIDPDSLDYSSIDGYYTNEEVEVAKQGKNAAEPLAEEILKAMKEQLKLQVKEIASDKGVSFDKISTAFESAFAQSVAKAVYDCVDGSGGGLFKHSYSWFHKKDLVDTFTKLFNENIAKSIDEQIAKQTTTKK